jgi:hypothetical protein
LVSPLVSGRQIPQDSGMQGLGYLIVWSHIADSIGVKKGVLTGKSPIFFG